MRKLFTTIFILSSLISFGQSSAVVDLWKLYNLQDFKSVIEKAKPLLENDPNNVDLNLIIGRSYADDSDFKNAIPYLESTIKADNENSWRKAWALGYLGTCHFMLQDYDNSKKALKESFELNATKNATQYAYQRILLFGFDNFYKDWKIVESDNFRFHFQNMSDSDIKNYVSSREEAFQNINKFFNSILPKKIDFFVWESKEDAKNLLKANLGFADPGFCNVHSHYQQTKGHEMTHVISNYTAKIINKTRFINEGTAVYFDMTNRDKITSAKSAIEEKDVIIDIKSMWQNKNIEEAVLYPVAGAFVEYLIVHGGKNNFLELFKNQTLENAYKIYGDTLNNWISDFEMKFSKADQKTTVFKQDTAINYQVANINQLDKVIKQQKEAGNFGVNPLILLNGLDYTFEEYEKDKNILSVLKQDKITSIALLTGESANTLKNLYKKSTSDGILLVTIGNLKKQD